MLVIVVFLKGLSRKVADDNEALNRLGVGLFTLVFLAFLPSLTKILSNNPVNEAVAALIGAAIIAFISQKFLALDSEYLAEAEKAPPLFSNRDKKLLKIEALTYGFYTLAALPKILPENVKSLARQGIEAAGEDIPYTISTVGVGALLLALIYWVFK